jgi:8-oxo-dGTP diphosphatase
MTTPPSLPYKIATLVDLRDAANRVLLLKRKKAPNLGLHSPIGGKLDMVSGESPAMCAKRETLEEVGLDVPIERFALLGIISETAYESKAHWLIFYYQVQGAVELKPVETADGWLDWHREEDLDKLDLPATDRKIIWPLVRKHEPIVGPDGRMKRPAGFFSVHIDCTGPGNTVDDFVVRVEQG